GTFNTNFAVAGVAVTATNLGAAAPTADSVINLAAFTGADNIAVTSHVTTGNTTISSGSGADTVAVTTDLMTTGIVKITTGNLADKISINSVAPGQANGGGVTSDFVITPGAGADSINLVVNPS